jgi:hypothetical protein
LPRNAPQRGLSEFINNRGAYRLRYHSSVKRNGSIALTVAALALASSCEKKMAAPPPPPPPETILGSESSGPQDSLFKGDQALLSDQDIARILNSRLSLTDRHRMAILSLGSNSWWSEDLADIEAKNFEGLLQALRAAPQLTEVRLLPSLLVPEKRTVPYLREAAARIQADLLFVYTTRIQTFRRDRFLKPNEVHAQCVAESVLLDVRTGIVADTARATENIALTKTASDLNFNETVARAEADARGKALVSLAQAVVKRLAKADN